MLRLTSIVTNKSCDSKNKTYNRLMKILRSVRNFNENYTNITILRWSLYLTLWTKMGFAVDTRQLDIVFQYCSFLVLAIDVTKNCWNIFKILDQLY